MFVDMSKVTTPTKLKDLAIYVSKARSDPHRPFVVAVSACPYCERRFRPDEVPGAWVTVYLDGDWYVTAACCGCMEIIKHADEHVRKQMAATADRLLQKWTRETVSRETHWLVESPIEEMFLNALVEHYEADYIFDTEMRGVVVKASGDQIACLPQFTVRLSQQQKYRLDFLFICKSRRGVKVAVELDGHDFHEKTKSQAQRDKARDRALTRAGYVVLRFTGSEVYRNAKKCVDEVLSCITEGGNQWLTH